MGPITCMGVWYMCKLLLKYLARHCCLLSTFYDGSTTFVMTNDVFLRAGIKWLRQQDTRSLLRERVDQTAHDRRQQTPRSDDGRGPPHFAVQARMSVDLRLGDQGPTAHWRRLQWRQHTQRKHCFHLFLLYFRTEYRTSLLVFSIFSQTRREYTYRGYK